jgi:Flp pilus assembly protein TadG
MKQFRDETGAALIEFIIVLIPLLVLMFASIEFGVAGYNKAMITNASREGARAGIVFDAAQAENRISNAAIAQIAQVYCADNMITFGTAAVPVVVVTRAGTEAGDDLTVSVSYNYGFLLLHNLIPGFSPTINLSAESVMRME